MFARSGLVLACLGLLSAGGCGDDTSSPQDKPRPPARAIDAGTEAGSPPTAADAGDGVHERTVSVRFRAALGEREFDCGASYGLPAFGKVVAREFKFYVNELKLIDAGGAEVPVRLVDRPPGQSADLALIDFDGLGGSCTGTPERNTEIVGKVPAGEYRGIVFSNGVPEQLNHADPLTLRAPLQDATMYWDWFQGFKFFAAEIGADQTDAASGGEDAGTFAPAQSIVHVGSVGCAADADMQIRCVRANRNLIRLPDFDPDQDVIVADLAAVFADADPRTQTFCHGPRATCGQVYGNIGIELATGEAAPKQRVYRVESR